jgi:hypothetical protein
MGGRHAAGRHAGGLARDQGSEAGVARVAMAQYGLFFDGSDVGGHEELSFADFVVGLPSHLRDRRPLSQLREWFAMIDTDGSGTVSLHEFFRWSLRAASAVSGRGLIQHLEAFDRDGDGRLDHDEFCTACEELGFGPRARRERAAAPARPTRARGPTRARIREAAARGGGRAARQATAAARPARRVAISLPRLRPRTRRADSRARAAPSQTRCASSPSCPRRPTARSATRRSSTATRAPRPPRCAPSL